MTKFAFKGSCVALITPFKNNKLDEEALENLINKTERAIEGRTKGGLDNTELSALLSELKEIKG